LGRGYLGGKEGGIRKVPKLPSPSTKRKMKLFSIKFLLGRKKC
jgi:hypothetical protein